jgi:hypothetical protein
MKKFIIKISGVITILLSLIIFSLNFRTNYNILVINHKSIDSADILILGDSRAERQIDPSVLHASTRLNCLNLAESALDLYSLTKRLTYLDLSNKILIISASFWQINDGSIELGYFRPEAVNDLKIQEKISIYKSVPHNLVMVQSEILKNNLLKIGNDTRYINKGYDSIICQKFEVQESFFKTHPWYKGLKTDGIKKNLLYQALINLNKLKCKKIIIYNAPVCDKFKEIAKKNRLWEAEKKYNNLIDSFIKTNGLENIEFYDLMELEGFNNIDYYDAQHFCKNGANKFSKKLDSIFKLTSFLSPSFQKH